MVFLLGVPSQPSNLRASDIGETSVTLQWSKPTHSGENIVSYELYWNDTYAREEHHRRIPVSESYTLTGLYPNTLYYVWLAARSQRGEGATTPPIPVVTKQYGKENGKGGQFKYKFGQIWLRKWRDYRRFLK